MATVKVVRATLAAHEPEKPEIKTQKAKAHHVLGHLHSSAGLWSAGP